MERRGLARTERCVASVQHRHLGLEHLVHPGEVACGVISGNGRSEQTGILHEDGEEACGSQDPGTTGAGPGDGLPHEVAHRRLLHRGMLRRERSRDNRRCRFGPGPHVFSSTLCADNNGCPGRTVGPLNEAKPTLVVRFVLFENGAVEYQRRAGIRLSMTMTSEPARVHAGAAHSDV